MAALSRMSRGGAPQHHPDHGRPDHPVQFADPGNEEAVYGVIDSLAKIGARS